MIQIPAIIAILSKGVASVASNIGGNIISNKIEEYIKNRKNKLENELKLSTPDEQTILIMNEIIKLKDIELEIAMKIINGDNSKEEEIKMIEELNKKTNFISNMQDIVNLKVEEIQNKIKKD